LSETRKISNLLAVASSFSERAAVM
ncbi:unnamed protein product, partial [Allacma fusca]